MSETVTTTTGEIVKKPRKSVRVAGHEMGLGGQYPGSMPLAVAMVLALLGYFIINEWFFNNGTPGYAQTMFSLFVALSWGFLALVVFGHAISQTGKMGSTVLMAIILWAGMNWGVWFLGLFGVLNNVGVNQQPMALLSWTGSTIAGYTLPFSFMINGADYTWLFLIVVLGILYYTFDDWRMWISGPRPQLI